jgi:hypothetical protein
MKKITVLFISFIFLAKLYAQDPPGISVKPVRLFYTLLNGQTSTQTVYIVNNSGQFQQFKLYLQDWTRDEKGKHFYMKLGIFPQSCARWVTLDKQFIELKPGETGEVLVKVAIPDSLSVLDEMKWTMLFVETTEEKLAPSKQKGTTTTVHNISRIGVHVVQTPPTLKEKSINMISFKSLPGDSSYRIVCQNTGKIQYDCSSYIELSSVATGEKTTIRANMFPLFPNQIRYVDFTIPNTLQKGKYTMTAVVDAGDDLPLQVSESSIEIK